MKELLFIRHAESSMNIQPDIIGGRSDHAEITDNGIEQARKLGHHIALRGIIPALVYRSPAVRTMQTAQYTLDAMDHGDMPHHIDPDLLEMSQGSYVGLLRTEIYPPEVIARLDQMGMDAKLPDPDCESMNEVGVRMHRATEKITSEIEDGETALVFSHGLAIRCLVARIKGWNRAQTFGEITKNTSVTTIHADAHGQLRVIDFANAAHLE